ncbi:MAG TPA: sigma-70 family RNA polymerase sigma factor [Rhodothermales bacterium]|nr:sigma-70 family RNA polymerase sigma factor [Rhodothermales bacterium]HRR07921.1 sigma-70 family RNA polymerase sigma factor [Rhodothermales bacterium]
MPSDTGFGAVEELAAQLPFHLDDSDAASQLFSAWRKGGVPRLKPLVDLYVYCIIMRYFSAKYLQNRYLSEVEVERYAGDAYERAIRFLNTIKQETSIAGWLNSLCRNQFLNLIREHRKRNRFTDVDEWSDRLEDEYALRSFDTPFFIALLHQAIQKLPEFLKATGHYRFIEYWEFDQIAEAIQKTIPTVRAYCHKIVDRFKQNPHLRELIVRHKEK